MAFGMMGCGSANGEVSTVKSSDAMETVTLLFWYTGDPDFVWEYRHRRFSLQVAELKYADGELTCDRNRVELFLEQSS